jgi:C4-type Zn-finger protein
VPEVGQIGEDMEIRRVSRELMLDVKRFYHGHEIKDDCPKCKTTEVIGEDEYISYPNFGRPTEIHFYCGKCNHKWSRKVLITVNIDEVI